MRIPIVPVIGMPNCCATFLPFFSSIINTVELNSSARIIASLSPSSRPLIACNNLRDF